MRNPHAPYINAVIEAMEAMSVDPADWWVSDAETGADGETCTLSAVISWNGKVSPEEYPDGLLLCWNLEQGWQYAGMRPDGSNDWPEDLPLPLWADPADVAASARALLRGEQWMSVDHPQWHDDAVSAAVKAWVES